MNYIEVYEKWGIDKSLEDIANEWLNIIKNSNKKEFNFTFKPKNFHEITVKVVVLEKQNKTLQGEYSFRSTNDVDYIKNRRFDLNKISDYKIELGIVDKGVILHELKHIDHLFKVNGKTDIIKISNSIQYENEGWDKDTYLLILYLLNDDEFEAKYHGHYIGLINYIKSNMEKYEYENPTKSYIRDLVSDYMSTCKDKSFFKVCRWDRIEILTYLLIKLVRMFFIRYFAKYLKKISFQMSYLVLKKQF